jgi:hypothetical protein
MDAYELADWLDRRRDAYEPNGWSADMLRQQADRIAELEDRLSMYEIKDLDRGIIGKIGDCPIHDLVHRTTPQIKDLSDEQIYQEMIKCIDSPDDGHEFRYKDFARAILKKASEK